MRLKRILLATDLSAASGAAERLAADLARTLGAELLVAFCATPLEAGSLLAAWEVAAVLQEQDEAARAGLARRARLLRGRAPRVREVFVAGEAAPAITDTARRLRADLIVIGTHGRSGFSRWTIGSVAERVVRTATCPVLTVRSTGAPGRPERGARGRKGRRPAPSRTTRSKGRA